MQFDVEFFELSNGKKPVEEFLLTLDKKLRAKTVRNIKLLQEFGMDLGEPFTKPIEGGIFELRTKQSSNIDRIFCFFVKGRKIILTNGFLKKDDKIPPNEIILAKKYKNQYEDQLL